MSRDDLIAGLQMLIRLQGRKKKIGRARWTLEDETLTISWGEAQQVIDARVAEPGSGFIEGDFMRSLAARLPPDEILELTVEKHRVRLGSLLIDTRGVIDDTSPKLAPDAPDLDVLTAAVRLTREEWRAAGIEERVDQAIARSREAISAAAAVLAPFAVDERAISTLVSDSIKARSVTNARGAR